MHTENCLIILETRLSIKQIMLMLYLFIIIIGFVWLLFYTARQRRSLEGIWNNNNNKQLSFLFRNHEYTFLMIIRREVNIHAVVVLINTWTSFWKSNRRLNNEYVYIQKEKGYWQVSSIINIDIWTLKCP